MSIVLNTNSFTRDLPRLIYTTPGFARLALRLTNVNGLGFVFFIATKYNFSLLTGSQTFYLAQLWKTTTSKTSKHPLARGAYPTFSRRNVAVTYHIRVIKERVRTTHLNAGAVAIFTHPHTLQNWVRRLRSPSSSLTGPGFYPNNKSAIAFNTGWTGRKLRAQRRRPYTKFKRRLKSVRRFRLPVGYNSQTLIKQLRRTIRRKRLKLNLVFTRPKRSRRRTRLPLSAQPYLFLNIRRGRLPRYYSYKYTLTYSIYRFYRRRLLRLRIPNRGRMGAEGRTFRQVKTRLGKKRSKGRYARRVMFTRVRRRMRRRTSLYVAQARSRRAAQARYYRPTSVYLSGGWTGPFAQTSQIRYSKLSKLSRSRIKRVRKRPFYRALRTALPRSRLFSVSFAARRLLFVVTNRRLLNRMRRTVKRVKRLRRPVRLKQRKVRRTIKARRLVTSRHNVPFIKANITTSVARFFTLRAWVSRKTFHPRKLSPTARLVKRSKTTLSVRKFKKFIKRFKRRRRKPVRRAKRLWSRFRIAQLSRRRTRTLRRRRVDYLQAQSFSAGGRVTPYKPHPTLYWKATSRPTFRPTLSRTPLKPRRKSATQLLYRNVYQLPFISKPYSFIYTFNPSNRALSKANQLMSFRKRQYAFSFIADIKRARIRRFTRTKSLVRGAFFTNKRKPLTSREGLTSLLTGLNKSYRFGLSTPSSRFGTPALFKSVSRRNYWTTEGDFRQQQVRVKRIRFKPGYSRIWRSARHTLKTITGLTFRYQYRLTRHLLTFYRGCSQASTLQLTVGQAVVNAMLVPDRETGNLFITNSMVFLNGHVVRTPATSLVVGDFIQLIVTTHYYVTQRWMLNWFTAKVRRLRRTLILKQRRKSRRFGPISKLGLPNWLVANEPVRSDVLKCFEVDYFTLSLFVVYNPVWVREFVPTHYVTTSRLVYNMYNWKYIT